MKPQPFVEVYLSLGLLSGVRDREVSPDCFDEAEWDLWLFGF